MKLGYARVSTDEQSLDVQLEQLERAECNLVFQEKQSGKNAGRPELAECLRILENAGSDGYPIPQYVLVVCKLDRLARNTKDLLEIVERIGKAGAGLISLAEPWADTTSPAGKLIMTVFAGVAQFERERTMERAAEGRAKAKANGVHMGRRPALSVERRFCALEWLKAGRPVKDVARFFGVAPSTIRRLRARA